MAVVQKVLCQVEKVVPCGERVYMVNLRAERSVPRFRPGQFLHLALDPYDPSGFWPDSRVFSIASPPKERNRLSISYSVRGRFTARMEKELAEGRWVWVKLPYGDFVVDVSRDVVLFAGGTGITAFTAFLGGLHGDFSQNVYLAYGARNKTLLIYRDLLERLSVVVRALKVFYFVERGDERGQDGVEKIGCLSVAALWPEIRAPFQTSFYLSGPPLMIRDISQDLRQRGVNPGDIRIDAWE